MRYAFISDIHGNAVALDAVLNDIKRKSIDRIVVLGDICFRGPEPKRALELVKSNSADVIRGNADEWMVRGIRENEVPLTAFDTMKREREWGVSRLSQEDITYLTELPASLTFIANEKTAIHVFHATPDSLFNPVPPDGSGDLIKQQFHFESTPEQILVYAHIHQAYIRYIDGKTVINTGSVGIPFDGLTQPSYSIVEVGEKTISTSIERVSYDIEKVIEQYKESDYPNAEQMIGVTRSGLAPQ